MQVKENKFIQTHTETDTQHCDTREKNSNQLELFFPLLLSRKQELVHRLKGRV